MCGIIYYIGNKDLSILDIEKSVKVLELRGPDNNNTIEINFNNIMGFARLSINDISESGNQPLIKDNRYFLICNGEIYNHKILKDKYNFICKSESDCEVIINMFEKFGLDNCNKIINELDGVFSFILYDKKLNKSVIARDPYGVRPLFMGYTQNNELLFCSELKPISNYCKTVDIFKPGHYTLIDNSLVSTIGKNSNYIPTLNVYHNFNFEINTDSLETIKNNIRTLLMDSVKKRLMSDRPIGCLLSGGLDSSLISSLVSKYFKPYTLNTFSIGMKGSTDLYYAKMAAEHIKSNHHNIELTTEDFLNAIEKVIYIIESYDITTVRASVGNYLVGKYIKENTDCKVIYNGDGSEEIMGSYRWFSYIDNEEDFYKENYKLLREISYYDVLRSDRSISDNGLEARVPFLDKTFVDYVMSIPAKYKMFGGDIMEKKILREAFENDNLLPKDVLWRKKEAFSDGVSSNEKSWFTIIQEHLEETITDEEFNKQSSKYIHNKPFTKEALYYRNIFEKYFTNKSNVIPHYWMPNPKWCNVNDPSARIIKTN